MSDVCSSDLLLADHYRDLDRSDCVVGWSGHWRLSRIFCGNGFSPEAGPALPWNPPTEYSHAHPPATPAGPDLAHGLRHLRRAAAARSPVPRTHPAARALLAAGRHHRFRAVLLPVVLPAAAVVGVAGQLPAVRPARPAPLGGRAG